MIWNSSSDDGEKQPGYQVLAVFVNQSSLIADVCSTLLAVDVVGSQPTSSFGPAPRLPLLQLLFLLRTRTLTGNPTGRLHLISTPLDITAQATLSSVCIGCIALCLQEMAANIVPRSLAGASVVNPALRRAAAIQVCLDDNGQCQKRLCC